MTSLSLLGLKALIPYQTPCLRFNFIHRSSAPALSDSQLHPVLCTASFGGEVQCAQFHVKHFAHQCKDLLPHQYSPYLPSPEGEHRGTRYVWVHAKIRPWGHQFPVQCPEGWCIRPWVSTSQGLVEFFGCEHCNHWLTFVEPPEKYNWLGGVVFGGRWLAVEHLA